MKVDKETLIKHRFWILLGLEVPLVLIATLVLLFGVQSDINARQKKVETQRDAPTQIKEFRNHQYLAALDTAEKVVNAKLAVLWQKGWESQEGLATWPVRGDKVGDLNLDLQKRFNGLFAVKIKVSKEHSQSMPLSPDQQQYMFRGRIKKLDDRALTIEGEKEVAPQNFQGPAGPPRGAPGPPQGPPPKVEKKAPKDEKLPVKTFYPTPKMAVGIDNGSERTVDSFATLRSVSDQNPKLTVEVTFIKGKYFGDDFTDNEKTTYTAAYAKQLDELRQFLFDNTDKPRQLVQIKGGWGRKPPKMIRYVETWDKANLADAEAIWFAQEDLWIQRELLRVIRDTNEYVGTFQPQEYPVKLQSSGGNKKNPILTFKTPTPGWELQIQLIEIPEKHAQGMPPIPKQTKMKATLINKSGVKQLLNFPFTVLVSKPKPKENEKKEDKKGPKGAPPPMGGPPQGFQGPPQGFQGPPQGQPQGPPETANAGPRTVELRFDEKLKDDLRKARKKGPAVLNKDQKVEIEEDCTSSRPEGIFEISYVGKHVGFDESKYVFRSPLWMMEIRREGNSLKATLTNLARQRQLLDIGFLVQVTPSNPDDKNYRPKRVQLDFAATEGKENLKPGESTTTTAKFDRDDPEGIFGVEQILTLATAPVKRLEDMKLSEHSHRTYIKNLHPRKLSVDPNQEPPQGGNQFQGGAPQQGGQFGGGQPGSAPPGGGQPGSVQPGGGLPDKDRGNANKEKSAKDRYSDSTEQFRKMPVAMVLVIDQNSVHYLLAAFEKSRLRFQVTQVLLTRYAKTLKAEGPVKGKDKKPKKKPMGEGDNPMPRPVGGPMGGSSGPRPPSGGSFRPPVPDSAGGSFKPPMGRDGNAGGQVFNQPRPNEAVEVGPASTTEMGPLMEVVVYGYATIYERYPSKPPALAHPSPQMQQGMPQGAPR